MKTFLKRIIPFLFPLFLIAILLLMLIYWPMLRGFFSDRESLQQWVDSFGKAAPVIFCLIQLLQVIVFVIPGEIPQIAGGYLFGVWGGTLLSLLSITLGSVINFYIGRWFGKPFVERVLGGGRMKRYISYSEDPKAETIFFLLFVLPGFPKDALCYIAGISPIRIYYFLLFSLVGRLPGILGSSFIGNSVSRGEWLPVVILLGVAGIVTIFGMLQREKIHEWINKLRKR